MGESHENLLKVVRHCQQSLDKYTENRNDGKLLHYLEKLYKLPIKVVHLEQTGVGRTVNGLRKLGGDVGDSAKSLVAKWKEMVVGEQQQQEEDEDDDDDEEEDGYQTGEEMSNDSDDKDREEKPRTETSSSHRKSDSSSREKHKSRHSSSSDKKDKHQYNGHHKHQSQKRKGDDSSTEDETVKKRHKSESKRKHESDKHKSVKKYRDSSSDFEDTYKSSSKSKEKPESSNKDKKKSDSRKFDERKSREHDKERKNKEDKKERSDEKKVKKSKPLDGSLRNNGIDSGSGASFAEALGMCEPSSSKNSVKKKEKEKGEKKEKASAKVDDLVPKPLKEPALEPIDLNLSSLLPPITPNYRPLGNLISSDVQPKKMSESEALTSIITSKNQRTKVYSGNKIGYGKVPSLFDLCIRILQDNIDALEYTGGVPYTVLKPILEKANPNQLYMMEHHNPYLIEDTDELWQFHCQKDFRNKKREELETWREMYLRCLDERDAKLKALTANIKQSQDKSLPVRMTKLAYVDAVAKPPRNIARKQAKNGTAFDIRKPSATPSSKLTSLATAGEAGKVAVPNPGSRAADRSSGHHKPKKAPLMLKSITSFKNRFKR